jgi:asparagine synthase (glutamine-hydrolysing)
MADHEIVAVSVSGGLDSFAVLLQAARIADEDGRKVVATIAEMIDDAGYSNVVIAQRLITSANLRNVELHVSATDELPEAEPAWHVEGPALDALPLANLRLAEIAYDHGATIMLGGNGADELLGAVRYLFGSFICSGDGRAFQSYWSDTVGVEWSACKTELLTMPSRLLPKKWRALGYFAAEWPELSRSSVPDILSTEHHAHVSDWSASWVSSVINHHAHHHASWATMAAWDAVFPLHILSGTGPMPLIHPFLTPDFVAAAQQLTLTRRYDPQLPHAYWRQKAQVLALIPESIWGVLPIAKQTFRAELSSRYLADKLDAFILIALGILDPVSWEKTTDALLINRVNKLELWIRGAITHGYSMAHD